MLEHKHMPLKTRSPRQRMKYLLSEVFKIISNISVEGNFLGKITTFTDQFWKATNQKEIEEQ